MEVATSQNFSFHGFTFSVGEKCLRYGEEIVKLSPTALEVLAILLEKQGEVVSRETLIDEVWKDTIVEEANLTVAISQIRKSFAAKSGKEVEFIRTIPKKGYIFVAKLDPIRESSESESLRPVEPKRLVEENRNANTWLLGIATLAVFFATSLAVWSYYGPSKGLSSIPISERSYRSIAVLPIQDLDDSEDNLSFGITDSLITRLGRLNRFAVRPLSAVSAYSENKTDAITFAKTLDVDAVVTGNLQRSGKKIRLSMQMLDPRDGAQLWNDSFDMAEGDIFSLQDKVSTRIAEKLLAKLSPAESNALRDDETTDLSALRLYSQGKFFLSKRTRKDIEKAQELFEKANEIDPDYLNALRGRLDCLVLLADSLFLGSPTEEIRRKITPITDKILKISPQDSTALSTKGFVAFNFDWNVDEAIRYLDQAIESDPYDPKIYNWKAWTLLTRQDFTNAEAYFLKARSLDPTSRIFATEAAVPAIYAGDYERAETFLNEALALDQNFFQARMRRWYLELARGNHENALREAEKLKEISSENNAYYLVASTMSKANLGQIDEAKETYNRMKSLRSADPDEMPSILLSAAAVSLGSEDAFNWLETALESKNDYLLYIHFVPEYRSVRNNPRFQKLVKQVEQIKKP